MDELELANKFAGNENTEKMTWKSGIQEKAGYRNFKNGK